MVKWLLERLEGQATGNGVLILKRKETRLLTLVAVFQLTLMFMLAVSFVSSSHLFSKSLMFSLI